MAEEQFIFEEVSELTAIARGVPGNRTFYLVAGRGRTWVRAWFEKELLQGLSTALDQLLATLDDPGDAATQEAGASQLSAREPPEPPTGEFRVERLALGHDTERDMIIVMAHQQNLEESDPPTLQFSASKSQLRALSQRIKEVCAAGRPICPLCSGPINPEGHTCPKSNGHHALDAEFRQFNAS